MKTIPTIQNIAIIGAGTMGHALALVHAVGGCRVRLTDNSEPQLAQAPALIEAALDTIIEAGQVDSRMKPDILARITTHATLAETLEQAQLVVEAVVENRDVKREVFRQLDELLSEDVIIASNTSHLDIFPLMPPRRLPRAAIAHWYTPPYIIDLVDLAPGPETEAEVIGTLRELYAGFGKKPVVFKTMLPGYVANRLQAALGLEIFHLLDEGLVSAQDIDDSIMHGLSLRMVTLGYFRKADFTGLDMLQRALANNSYTPPPVRDHSPSLDRPIEQGRGGVMAGAGFYDYGGRPATELFRERDIKLLKLKSAWQNLENDSENHSESNSEN
jgi:3-hydroxybutyryl-CoA dehydrogenase